jgi:hypothetical protein
MTAGLLAAHQAGRVEVAVGRASDFFGPGITSSALGETVFGAAVNGRTAQVMGRGVPGVGRLTERTFR